MSTVAVTLPNGRPRPFADALADALDYDHGACSENTCDIREAREGGFERIAAHLLQGATECETVDAVVAFYVDNRGESWPDMYHDPQWEGWAEHFDRWGRQCEACGAFAFAEPYWEPETCGNCRADLPTRGEGGE